MRVLKERIISSGGRPLRANSILIIIVDVFLIVKRIASHNVVISFFYAINRRDAVLNKQRWIRFV